MSTILLAHGAWHLPLHVPPGTAIEAARLTALVGGSPEAAALPEADWIFALQPDRLVLKRNCVAPLFCHDLPPDHVSVRRAVDAIVDQSRAAHDAPVAVQPGHIRDIPATLVVCADDRLVPRALQRRCAVAWGARAVEIASGHSPWLRAEPLQTLVELIDTAI